MWLRKYGSGQGRADRTYKPTLEMLEGRDLMSAGPLTSTIGVGASAIIRHVDPVRPVAHLVVTANPADVTVNAGQEATFHAASSDPSARVKWQVSRDGGQTFQDLAGAKSATLTFTAKPDHNEFRYRAVFTNAAGKAVTSAAELFVNSAPVITTQPVSVTVAAGRRVSFTADASGYPTPGMNWQVSSDGGKTFSDIPWSGGFGTLTFIAQASDTGKRYRAVFSNGLGTATTKIAILHIDIKEPTGRASW